VIPFDPIRRPRGRRGFPCRGAVAAALSVLLPVLVAGCVTPGVQGIQGDLDSIQEQLFRVQKENAAMAEKLAALRETAVDTAAAPDGPSMPEINLRIEAIERDLAALGLRHDQTDQRLAALVQDLRSTREALQALLRTAPLPGHGAPAAGSSGPDPGGETAANRLAPPGDLPASPGAAAASVLALEDLYRQGYSDYTKGNYALALVELEEFAERHPASDFADDSRYLIGEVHFSQEKYAEAVEAFDRVVKDYPGGDKAGPAYLKKGLALLEMNRTADAVIQLNHVITAYPQSEEARIARDRLEGLGLSAR
jgi:tol-pal system protein YbgF